MIYIICGVDGTGKSAVGRLLGDQLGLPFYDADDFHSEIDILKMASGVALNDSDRIKWFQILSSKIVEWETRGGAVLACSALKELYQKLLVPFPGLKVTWIALEGTRELILQRLLNRGEDSLVADKLDSQLEIYSRPNGALVFDIELPPDKIVLKIARNI